MTQRQFVERLRPYLVDLESRVERKVPGSSGGISDGSVKHHGDVWSQLTLEFIPSGDAPLLWVMAYVKAEDPLLHALVEFGRDEKVLGEFAPGPAPIEGDQAPAAALADAVGAFLLAQEERIVAELAARKS